MKKIINVDDTNKLFDALKDSSDFSCEEITSGLKVKYNGIVTVLAAPDVRLIRLSDSEIKITFSPNGFILIVSLLITVFFWVIAFLAAARENPNIAGTVIALAAPSVMWVLDIFVINRISKLILDEINNIAKE